MPTIGPTHDPCRHPVIIRLSSVSKHGRVVLQAGSQSVTQYRCSDDSILRKRLLDFQVPISSRRIASHTRRRREREGGTKCLVAQHYSTITLHCLVLCCSATERGRGRPNEVLRALRQFPCKNSLMNNQDPPCFANMRICARSRLETDDEREPPPVRRAD